MRDYIIARIIGLVAVFYLGRMFYRAAKGKGMCAMCGLKSKCQKNLKEVANEEVK